MEVTKTWCAVQLAAAEELITGLDLMTAQVDAAGHKSEALDPRKTFNPVLQRFYQALQARAMEPDCPLPELDPEIQKCVSASALHMATTFLISRCTDT